MTRSLLHKTIGLLLIGNEFKEACDKNGEQIFNQFCFLAKQKNRTMTIFVVIIIINRQLSIITQCNICIFLIEK